jgi:hypothetical protein
MVSFAALGQFRRIRIVHALAAVAVLAVACGAAARTASARVLVDPVTHHRLGIVPPLTGPQAAPSGAAASCYTSCSPLLYNGGPVQHGEQDYLLFWGSPSSFPAGFESGLLNWLHGVAAADNTTGNPFSVDTQYYDTSGAGGSNSYVPYAVQDAGALSDTDPYPGQDCTDQNGSTTESVCLTQSDIQNEVSSYVSARGLPTGLNTEYFVFTPPGVGSCFASSSSSSDCAYTGYCGYHSDMSINSGASEIVYADMPWLYGTSGCDVSWFAGYANSGDIDSTVGVFSHELSETMTDPNLNAWYDSSGNEIGDKCAYTYTPDAAAGAMAGLNNNGSGYWNVPLSTGDYLMQMEYDQRDGDCAVGLTNTWTGASAGTGWSQNGSWAGVLGPTGTVDTLIFPALTSGACTAVPATAACYSSNNDVSGLSARAIKIDDGTGYSITGDGLALGSGGITASTAASSPTPSTLGIPVTLSGAQAWTISGAAGGGGGLAINGVSGSGDSLAVALSNRAALNVGADAEVGALTVSGANPGDSGSGAAQNGTLTFTSGLNHADGAPVALNDVAVVTGSGASSGPLTATGASLQIGPGHAGPLSVAGSLSLDSASQLTLFLDGPGTSPGSDYSQISATGPVTLSGTLTLASGTSGCPTLVEGQADTLITTTGSLSGTFAGVPNGTTVTLPCGSDAPVVQINYTTNAVTATAVSSAPVSLDAPGISGLAEPGQVLTAIPGVWANEPSGVVDQWERCDADGANCAAIAGANGQQYPLSAGDLGSTIRIEEVAANANGSTAVWSAPTGLVAVPVLPAPPPAGQPGPAPAPGGSAPSAAPAAATPSQTAPSASATAPIRRVLLQILASTARPAYVGKLLARGGYSTSDASPGAGMVVVSWSLDPPKGTFRSHAKRNPPAVRVALGRAGAGHDRALRLKIRLTARGRRLLARRGKLTVTVTVTFTPAGSHRSVTIGRTFTIHR